APDNKTGKTNAKATNKFKITAPATFRVEVISPAQRTSQRVSAMKMTSQTKLPSTAMPISESRRPASRGLDCQFAVQRSKKISPIAIRPQRTTRCFRTKILAAPTSAELNRNPTERLRRKPLWPSKKPITDHATPAKQKEIPNA